MSTLPCEIDIMTTATMFKKFSQISCQFTNEIQLEINTLPNPHAKIL